MLSFLTQKKSTKLQEQDVLFATVAECCMITKKELMALMCNLNYVPKTFEKSFIDNGKISHLNG